MQGLGGLLGAVLVDEAETDGQRQIDADDHGVGALADEDDGGRGRDQQQDSSG